MTAGSASSMYASVAARCIASGEQYREFLGAESRGRYFLRNIRNRFRYERLAKLHAA
jgi:hypothetical protein